MSLTLQTICVGTPQGNRQNEDTYFIFDRDDLLIAGVFDGVTDRLFPSKYAEKGLTDGRTASAYAAHQARDAISEMLTLPPDQQLMSINNTLNQTLHDVYGADSPEAIYAQEPALTPYADDKRFVRLVLPACVATIIQLGHVSGDVYSLRYAHVGDTELLLFYADGRTQRAIVPHIPNWHKAIPPDVDSEPDETVRKFKRMGLFHNYVDANGRTDPTVGIGVLNGLPTMPDYMLTGKIDLQGVSGVCLCSDGLMWPSPRDETPEQAQARLNHMRTLIERDGLTGYVDALRAEEQADADHARYPRPKTHDDATGIFVSL